MSGKGREGADSVLIAALAGGSTADLAAMSAGVSRRTVFRRLQDPAFRRAVQEARADLVNRAVGILSASSTEAAETLRRLLTARSEGIQFAAAKAILELGTKLRESAEIEERLAALEEAIAKPPRRRVQ